MARRDVPLADLPYLYTHSVAQLARRLDTSITYVYDHLVDEDGVKVSWRERDVNRPVFLSIPGMAALIPVYGDPNGDAMFKTAECDEAFAASSRQLHPSVYR